MEPKVDKSLCSMCALCEEICPEVFEMGEDGIARVILANPGSELEEKVKEARDSCPTEAISS